MAAQWESLFKVVLLHPGDDFVDCEAKMKKKTQGKGKGESEFRSINVVKES